ncbi:S8 family serine peptidase [Halomontanus rarus]|uniref:S8 family serine peptidase n=1 Tax=Halomontanus rarus TaxID=3034020 RepID=UPI001A9A22AE
MRTMPGDGRSRTAVVLTAVVMLSLSLSLPLFAPIGTGGATSGNTAMNDSLVPASGGDPAPLDAELETDDGTVEVLVRLEEVDQTVLARNHDGVDALQSHANATQEPFERYVEATDGIELENRFWLSNALLVNVDTDTHGLERLARLEGVTGVHANHEVHLPEPELAPSTGTADSSVQATAYQTTYGLEQINAPDVWADYGTKGEGVSVAVLDTGVDPDHPDIEIASENWAEFERDGSEDTESTPYDTLGHGTHVSGTVTGGDSSGAYIGVAPGATLMHGKVLGEDGGNTAQVIAGMEWAVQADADVISLSLGADGYDDTLLEAVQNAHAADVLVVAAAGNAGEGTTGSPANLYDSFAIGASDSDGNIADFSGGEEIVTDDVWDSPPEHWPETYVVPDVAAPGVRIVSSIPGGGYERQSGTSMATPHVSGTAALMLGASNGELELDEITASLEETARKPDGEPEAQDVRYGHGIVDAFAATERAVADSTIAGTVTDADGTPLENVRVTLETGLGTTTDENGAYELSARSGERTVTAEKSGYKTSERRITVEEGARTTHDISLDEFHDVASFSGTVDLAGEPAPEGTTVIAHVDGESRGTTSVATDGRYATSSDPLLVDGVAGDDEGRTITFTVDGMPVEETATWANGTTEDLDLTVATGDLEGTVTAISYTEPIADATVVLRDSRSTDVDRATTTKTGAYEFTNLVPGEYAIDVRAPGFESVNRDALEVDGGVDEPPTRANVSLSGAASIVGTVDDALNDPVANATVTATGEYGASETTTDDDGTYGFDDLPGTGGYTVEATADGYVAANASTPLESNETKTVDLTLDYEDAFFHLTDLEVPESVDQGESVVVNATIENVGTANGTRTVTLEIVGENDTDETVLELGPGEAETVGLEWATGDGDLDSYDVTVRTDDDERSASVVVRAPDGPPPIVGDAPPQDTTGDGLYDDLNGDGELTVSDVQVLYDRCDSDEVRAHAYAFDFSGNGTVSVQDVQALYTQLTEA